MHPKSRMKEYSGQLFRRKEFPLLFSFLGIIPSLQQVFQRISSLLHNSAVGDYRIGFIVELYDLLFDLADVRLKRSTFQCEALLHCA